MILHTYRYKNIVFFLQLLDFYLMLTTTYATRTYSPSSSKGMVVLESNSPYEELVTIESNNDVVKIDGNMAIAWSSSLEFTVEKVTKTLIGSAASGEGLVNVYRGTGRILTALVK